MTAPSTEQKPDWLNAGLARPPINGVDQVTPMHFHWNKVEDIINRAGGKLVIQLYNATADDGLADSAVTASIDGVERMVKAGERVVLAPGESITLLPRLYHKF